MGKGVLIKNIKTIEEMIPVRKNWMGAIMNGESICAIDCFV